MKVVKSKASATVNPKVLKEREPKKLIEELRFYARKAPFYGHTRQDRTHTDHLI